MDEEQLSLRQADQIRGDLYAIQDDLDFIKATILIPFVPWDTGLSPTVAVSNGYMVNHRRQRSSGADG
jgi:hypothetical protein